MGPQRVRPRMPHKADLLPGLINPQTLQADPEFQALSAPEQAQLMQRVQAQSPGEPERGLTRAARRPALTEGFTKPSTMIPLLTGVGIPGRVAMAPAQRIAQQVIGKSEPWVGRFVRPITEGISQTLGFGTGRTIETGKPTQSWRTRHGVCGHGWDRPYPGRHWRRGRGLSQAFQGWPGHHQRRQVDARGAYEVASG